jgi:phosphocarrier protein HPr
VTDPRDKANRSSRVFEIRNQYGIHARPAAMLVKAASRFNCDITVEKDGSSVSGKSIMGLMTLEAGRGTKLRITAEGEDHTEAMAHLQGLFDRKFDED